MFARIRISIAVIVSCVVLSNLGTAQDMSSRHQPDIHIIDPDRLAIGDRLQRSAGVVAVPRPHDGQSLRRGKHRSVVGPGMVGVAVGDHGLVDRSGRVDMESARFDIQAVRPDADPAFRLRRRRVHGANMVHRGRDGHRPADACRFTNSGPGVW